MVMFGTKRPSITSTWIQSAPAASTARTSSPKRAKSADRMEGAMMIDGVRRLTRSASSVEALPDVIARAPYLSFAGGRSIDKPKQLTDRPNPRGRYLTVAGADRAEDGRLFVARDQKCDTPAALDHRIRHGDADLRPAMGDGGHPMLAFVQHRLSRQQR